MFGEYELLFGAQTSLGADIIAACSYISIAWDTSGVPYGLEKSDLRSEDRLGV